MRRLAGASAALLILLALSPPVGAQQPTSYRSGTTYAEIGATEIVLGNELVERRWASDGFHTVALTDKRVADGIVVAPGPDFRLWVGPATVASDLFDVTSVEVTEVPGGLRAEIHLAAPGITATRVAEIYEGIAGVRTQTILTPLAPLALRGATLDEAAVGTDVAATIHALRAGADWREPEWDGPPLSLGDPHAGTWRDSRTGGPGEDLEGAGQWISTASGDHSLFMVMERTDWPSSRAAYTDGIGRLAVDYSADIVGLGPFEEDAHVENPFPGQGRHRLLEPGQAFSLEPAFTGFGAHPDDEPWQFYKYLSRHRMTAYDNAVTFNSNGTDSNKISTGAKDDMNYQTVLEVAPIARNLGIETFILDDGWQAISGDWFPDCPEHPEPRWDGTPGSKFAPRFPDCEFQAVRDAIAPMKLGLWMSPMHFNPKSETYRQHPEWACGAIGHALAAANAADPNSGSNEAGIGTWGPRAIPHIEERIRTAIQSWGVEYFKFDFLVWLDCQDQGDMYDYHDAFVAMVDRLAADYPHVTFQIDETNDYRMFPFESVARGPSWFQNGSPEPNRLLHNLWNLSPYVPGFSLGQHFLGGKAYERYPVDTLMAAALPSHLTFFSDLRAVPASVIEQARPWLDFHAANRDLFTQMTYPLLADPIEGGWTALQPWDPEQGEGALLVFRQGSPDATRSVALRNVPPDRTFDLLEGPTGALVGTVSSEELTSGLEITLPEPNSARVLLIVPAEVEPPPPAPTSMTLTLTRIKGRVQATAVLTETGTALGLEGRTVSFFVDGVEAGSAVTDATGSASLSVGKLKKGQIVRAAFAGDDSYASSFAERTY